MCDSDELVFLLGEGLLDGVKLWSVTDRCLELSSLDAVYFKAVGKTVGEVASVQDQHFVAALSQVGRDQVPSEGAGAGDDERLAGWVLGDEEASQHGQGLSEGVDEGCTDV